MGGGGVYGLGVGGPTRPPSRIRRIESHENRQNLGAHWPLVPLQRQRRLRRRRRTPSRGSTDQCTGTGRSSGGAAWGQGSRRPSQGSRGADPSQVGGRELLPQPRAPRAAIWEACATPPPDSPKPPLPTLCSTTSARLLYPHSGKKGKTPECGEASGGRWRIGRTPTAGRSSGRGWPASPADHASTRRQQPACGVDDPGSQEVVSGGALAGGGRCQGIGARRWRREVTATAQNPACHRQDLLCAVPVAAEGVAGGGPRPPTSWPSPALH